MATASGRRWRRRQRALQQRASGAAGRLGNIPPSTYQCVAGLQTEDPLSPTCVPFNQGDNGGSTYQGVTAKEVRNDLGYERYGSVNTSQGISNPP